VSKVEFDTFQSTRPRGARQEEAGRTISEALFQSTRPRGARLEEYPTPFSDPMFQSTRPRGARPSIVIIKLEWSIVSIHAPAWGATWPQAIISPG